MDWETDTRAKYLEQIVYEGIMESEEFEASAKRIKSPLLHRPNHATADFIPTILNQTHSFGSL